MIVMGWRGRSKRRDFLFGSTVDPVLERNPCDVVVLKNCTVPAYRNILVPFGGGPHSLLALHIAAMLVQEEDGTIVPFNVEEAAEHDLVIIGAAGERRFRQLSHVSLPEAVAREVDCPLIMVKAKTPVKALVNRWL